MDSCLAGPGIGQVQLLVTFHVFSFFGLVNLDNLFQMSFYHGTLLKFNMEPENGTLE